MCVYACGGSNVVPGNHVHLHMPRRRRFLCQLGMWGLLCCVTQPVGPSSCKRDLLSRQKRPIIEAKETNYTGKRDLEKVAERVAVHELAHEHEAVIYAVPLAPMYMCVHVHTRTHTDTRIIYHYIHIKVHTYTHSYPHIPVEFRNVWMVAGVLPLVHLLHEETQTERNSKDVQQNHCPFQHHLRKTR